MFLKKVESATPQHVRHLIPRLTGAGPGMVHDSGGRNTIDIPSTPLDLHTPVDFFGVHEEVFVHETHLPDDFCSGHHGGAQWMINGKRVASHIQ
jgi:hypothetical protein